MILIALERDFSALNSRRVQVRTVMHGESKVWSPETVEDIRHEIIRSSMEARSKGNTVLLVVNLGTLACIK